MPKEFSVWLGEMANTIEDNSGFIKPSYDITTLTPSQRRMHIADLLVPIVTTEDDVEAWVCAFCVSVNTSSPKYPRIYDESLAEVLGVAETNTYIETDGDTQSLAWLYQFKQKIISGRL